MKIRGYVLNNSEQVVGCNHSFEAVSFGSSTLIIIFYGYVDKLLTQAIIKRLVIKIATDFRV